MTTVEFYNMPDEPKKKDLIVLLEEVRQHYTRDDDLPDNLLPRIDAALSAAQPKADERGSAEPVGVAGVMPGTEGGFTMAHFMAKAVPVGTKLYRHPDSAQARDAAQAVELTDAEIQKAEYATTSQWPNSSWGYPQILDFARAIERAVLAKNGLGGKQ